MKLYSYFMSSAAYRVRIALNLKGVDYETVPVDLSRGEHRQPAFLATNPQATRPVIDDDGIVLWQSLAIIDYLDARYPFPRLIPAEPVVRARVQAQAQLIVCEIHPLNNLRVRQYLREDLALDEAAASRWYRHWIGEGFASLEAQVRRSSGGRDCFGDAVTVAHVCLVPQVYNARRFHCDLAPYPTLVRIADGLAADPVFARAAPDRQPDAR